MVLSTGYGQQQLHEWSRKVVQHQQTIGLTSRSLGDTSNIHLPAYGTAAIVKDNPKIPNPSLFSFGSENSENDNTGLPTVAECAVHLELLEAFHGIYLKVSRSTALDTVLGIKPEPRTVYRRKYLGYRRGYTREAIMVRDHTFPERQKSKWTSYLTLAAARFLTWVDVVEKELDPLIASKPGLLHLPPIDILMVWHALLLNPSWFRSFEGRPLKNFYNVPFPWKEIHKAIDADKQHFLYNLPTEDIAWLVEKTSIVPHLFEYLVEGDKSRHVEEVLKGHGAPRGHQNMPRGFAVAAVNTVLKRYYADIDELDVKFLECCRETATKNTPVIKLVEAVQRQASFVQKMAKQVWIRSPAIEGTLHRAIQRYSKFLKLFKLYPHTKLVPTLDIDLVWHTHQCSPFQYDAGMVKLVGKFIDHDDKLGGNIIDHGLSRTKTLYRMRFGQEYQVCNCWDCEALLSAVTSHSAEAQPDGKAVADQVYEAVCYHRAVEIARRKGDTLLPVQFEPAFDLVII